MKPDLLITGPQSARATLILAHGAGAPMHSPFLEKMAALLADRRVRVVRFEFPYMAGRREGKRSPPNRAPILLDSWRAAIAAVGRPADLFIGGKSLGGRMATMVADEQQVRGVVCLGYPFHPPGKPDRLRTAHLEAIVTPTLIVQGERDTFGTAEEVATYALSGAIELAWMPDGDHSLKPRKMSGYTYDGNLELAAEAIAAFTRAT